MTNLLNTCFILLGLVFYPLGYFIPKRNSWYVFLPSRKLGEREFFAENTKYLFLYYSQRNTTITPVWIGLDKRLIVTLTGRGFLAVYLFSVKGMWYSLRARYTFVNAAIPFAHWVFSANTKIVQLWHGKGMKTTGFGSSEWQLRNTPLARMFFGHYFKIVASSLLTALEMQKTFGALRDDVLVTGLPKHDALYTAFVGADIDTNPLLTTLTKGDEEWILYAPTWRNRPVDQPLKHVDLKRLNTFLSQKNMRLFVALHVNKYTGGTTLTYSQITFLQPGYDLMPHLTLFDQLVTDYSAIFADFLPLNRPIVFYQYDVERYGANDLGLIEGFAKLLPGKQVKTFGALLKALTGKDTYAQKRKTILNKYFEYQDGKACERLDKVLA